MHNISVNGRSYRLPQQPTVVVCVDGCEPDYLAQAVATGHMPWLKGALATGAGLIADCVTQSSSAALVKLAWRAATSNARSAESGGSELMSGVPRRIPARVAQAVA